MIRIAAVILCLAVALPLFALQSDPLSGNWTGDWGPNAADRNKVSVDLKWDGKALTGVVHSVNFPRPDVTLAKTSFNSATGSVHMEADSTNRGQTVHFVIDGKLANGVMSGSWNHDTVKGDFKISKGK